MLPGERDVQQLQMTAILASDVRSASYFTGIRVCVSSVDFRGILVQKCSLGTHIDGGKCV